MAKEVRDTFIRHFRIVEWPYEEPSQPRGGLNADGYMAAMAAENRLREKLRTGIIPAEIVLVAPERASVAEIDFGGHLCAPACAWLLPSAVNMGPDSPLHTAAYLGPGIHVIADVESDSFGPDPASDDWADAGSVTVTEGRLTKLHVPRWLRPVAALLADTYGVPVAVHGEPTDFDFVESEPIVFEDAISGPELERLRCYLADGALAEFPRGASRQGIRFEHRPCVDALFSEEGRIWLTQPPRELAQNLVTPLLERAAEHFGMPANRFICQLMSYQPGAQKLWHTDRNADVEPRSWSRTVSLSVLLGRHGDDFEGGEFETPAGTVDLSLGDAVAITSVTRHRVTPVETGTRASLVVFGSWDGWNRR